MTADDILADILRAEGGYVNNPADRGGETNFGITKATAVANGYTGPMKDLPREKALAIYRARYVKAPGYDRIAAISPSIGAELIDTGVNMGPTVATRILQRCLNGLNRQGRDYADVVVDGEAGPATRAALEGFLAKRGTAGVTVLLKAMNALQGERYVSLAEARQLNEEFLYGWLDGRVAV